MSNTEPVVISVILNEGVEMPFYASDLASGADVHAHLPEPVVIQPGDSALIPTGVRVSIPAGYEIQIRPRSGLALNQQITVLNTPGTVDADYRGELKVILMNHGRESFKVTNKMRIAQIVVASTIRAHFAVTTSFSSTSRGENGFGSTGG